MDSTKPSPLDTLIAVVQRYAKIEMPRSMDLGPGSTRRDEQYVSGWNDCLAEIQNQLVWRNDAALRATFELVLADVQLADSETVEAVRTLRRQRDEAVRREAEAEAVSASLRELATRLAHEKHDRYVLSGFHGLGHEGASETCAHQDCVLVRSPHGEQP